MILQKCAITKSILISISKTQANTALLHPYLFVFDAFLHHSIQITNIPHHLHRTSCYLHTTHAQGCRVGRLLKSLSPKLPAFLVVPSLAETIAEWFVPFSLNWTWAKLRLGTATHQSHFGETRPIARSVFLGTIRNPASLRTTTAPRLDMTGILRGRVTLLERTLVRDLRSIVARALGRPRARTLGRYATKGLGRSAMRVPGRSTVGALVENAGRVPTASAAGVLARTAMTVGG